MGRNTRQAPSLFSKPEARHQTVRCGRCLPEDPGGLDTGLQDITMRGPISHLENEGHGNARPWHDGFEDQSLRVIGPCKPLCAQPDPWNVRLCFVHHYYFCSKEAATRGPPWL